MSRKNTSEVNSILNKIKKNGGDVVFYFYSYRTDLTRKDKDGNYLENNYVASLRTPLTPTFFAGKSIREVASVLEDLKHDHGADLYRVVCN